MKTVRVTMWLLGLLAVVMISTIFFGDWEHWPSAFKQDIYWQRASGPFWGFVILVAMWISWAQVQAMKTQTNELIFQNKRFFFNHNDNPVPAGFWELQRVGGINAMKTLLNLPGNEGTVIYAKDAKVPFGPNRLALAVSKRVPFDDLPEIVKAQVTRYRMPPPYEIGYASAFVETRGKDWTAAIREWEKDNSGKHSTLVGQHQTITSLDHMVRVQRAIIDSIGKPKAVGWLQRTWAAMSDGGAEKSNDEAYNHQG